MTLSELSGLAGVSISAIGHHETGIRRLGAETQQKLAEILRVPLAEIQPTAVGSPPAIPSSVFGKVYENPPPVDPLRALRYCTPETLREMFQSATSADDWDAVGEISRELSRRKALALADAPAPQPAPAPGIKFRYPVPGDQPLTLSNPTK